MPPNNPLLRFRNAGCLAIVLAAPIASTGEAVWSNKNVSDISIYVTLQRFRIYADHCSAKVPQLKAKFDSRMQELSTHLLNISRTLLSSDAFKDMKDSPVPEEISFALKDSLDDARHNFERQDADAICPKTLQTLGQMDDESLKADLTQTLVAVQKMTQNLEKHASPGNSSFR